MKQIKTTDRWEFFDWLCTFPFNNALVILEKFENKEATTVTNNMMDTLVRCNIGKDSKQNLVYYGQEQTK
jgi:hypothetical protein